MGQLSISNRGNFGGGLPHSRPSGLAILALVLCLIPVTFPIGAFLAAMTMLHLRRRPDLSGSGLAMTGLTVGLGMMLFLTLVAVGCNKSGNSDKSSGGDGGGAIQKTIQYAHRAKCNKNLQRIGDAIRAYMADHAGTWPLRTNVGSLNEWDDAWHNSLFRNYIIDPSLLYCPENSKGRAAPGDKWEQTWTGNQRKISYVILDGMPAQAGGTLDPRMVPLGPPGKGWNIQPVNGLNQGFLCVQNTVSRDESGKATSTTTAYQPFVPMWSDFANQQNVAIMGDLVLESPNGWEVNHATAADQDPPGMNILYADGHTCWNSPDAPSSNSTTWDTQRLWRRIWTPDGSTFVRWLVNGADITMPDRRGN